MLDECLGSTHVKNLRAFLLLEVDFNDVHKIRFNGRFMPRLEEENLIPREIIEGRRTQAATHLVLNKNVVSQIANVKKLPTETTCADATHYHDRVAHPFASLCAQCFELDAECLLVLLKTMQTMKMHLRTAFGMSDRFYSREEGKPFQGELQGNGDAPPLWLIITIFLV